MSLEISLPSYVPEQIALYQSDHLLTQAVCRFDPARAARKLHKSHDVMAIDIGGDKIRAATYAVRGGALIIGDEEVLQSTGGAGYLRFLERLAEEAVATDLRVGISSATKLDGSVITRTVNLPIFFEEFGETHGADYENLFPGRSFVANDTIMGICGASTRLAIQGNATRHVAFFICGSGLGASVIHDGTAIHVEAAHVPLMERLNPLGQTTRCGVAGKDYVCVERVTAARAGIENLYRQQTGEARDGVTLARMYEGGDPLATLLYDTSALALAHATEGVMERYAFPDSDASGVVFHGGNFEIASYRDAVRRRLQRMPHSRARLVFARDLSANICLDGAAVAAVYYVGQDG
jgi:predicted NBD/HSP70 family sugar kinase